MKQFTWDRGLDFGETRTRLLEKLQSLRPEIEDSIYAETKVAQTATLLIQLVNGSRVSEAFDAMNNWANNNLREQEIKVRKRRKDVEFRLMVIPSELTDIDRLCCSEAIKRGISINSVEIFAIRVMGFNSHALRYSQITELARKGMTPQVIAKVTHHKTLNFILSYTQQKEADKALREIAG